MEMRAGGLKLKVIEAIWSTVAVMFCFSYLASGEILRLSKVVAEGSVNAERIELNHGNDHEVLFVEKQAIVTHADVKSAMHSPQQEDALDIALTEEGGNKLGAATKDAHGDMRIAVLIDEKVVTAPVVMQQLGNRFQLDGLKDYPGDDLDLLGWRIEGKSEEEIAKLLREKQQLENTPPPPRPKPEYYSDEEYAALKKAREKNEMFYLDKAPDEQELQQRLKKGMSDEDVVREFGHASSRSTDPDGLPKYLNYDLAPELRPVERKMHPDGFIVRFENGQVSSWGGTWTDAVKQGKPKGKDPRRLIVKQPEFEMGDERFGMIRWLEELQVSLKDGETKPHAQDYADLISLVTNVASAGAESASIEKNCSVIATLAANFLEVADLKKSSEGGINLFKLRDALKPYLFGEKPFPDATAAPGK